MKTTLLALTRPALLLSLSLLPAAGAQGFSVSRTATSPVVGPATTAQAAPTTSTSTTTAAVSGPQVSITTLNLQGFSMFPAAQIKAALSERLGIAEGQSVSADTLETGRQLLEQSYQEAGYPFTPAVRLTQAGGVVTYTVDETAPLTRSEVSGVTLIKAEQVRAAFAPLTQAKKFSPDAYQYALTSLARAYSEAGVAFDAQSVQGTLAGGVLKVAVTEPFVGTIDTSDLSLSSLPALQTRVGQPLTIAALNADARALSNASGQPVGWQAEPGEADAGRVTVTFGVIREMAAQKVSRVVVRGNTLLPTADILKVVQTQPGDTASGQLLQQDYYAIQKLYDDRGYGLAATNDSLDFTDGVLTFNLHEVKVAGYRFVWPDGKPLIDEKVLVRQLPAVGGAFKREELQRSLAAISVYDTFTVSGREAQAADPARPEDLTVTIHFAPQRKGIPISLGATYATQDGLGGEIAYSTNNFLKSGNTFGVTLDARSNDVGQRFSGGVNYTIPWIETSFLNPGNKRTSLSLGAWSNANGNNTLFVKGSDGLPTDTDTGRQYTLRSTGASVSLGRELNPALSARIGVSMSASKYYLEPYKSGDSSTVTTANAATYQNDTTAAAQLPLGSTTALSTLGLNYDTTNSPIFPSQGVRGQGSLGYGFGVQRGQNSTADTRLSWGQVEAGGSTYLGFGRTLDGGTQQNVLAARVNAGTLVGTAGEANVYSVGQSMNPAYELRGQSATLHGTSYLTASTELRHDFGVKANSIIQGVYGLAFLDTGTAWYNKTNNSLSLNTSYGLGAQVNTGLLNLQLTYGRTTSGNGKFAVRIGSFW